MTYAVPPEVGPTLKAAVRPSDQPISSVGARALHASIAVGYLLVFLRVYRDYISVTWAYTGLTYSPLTGGEMILVILGVIAVASAMPPRIKRPSSIILWLMFAFVYVPTVALTPILGDFPSHEYLPALAALTVSLIAACGVSQWGEYQFVEREAIPRGAFLPALLAFFAFCTAVLYTYYRDILSFSSIEDVYYQRFAASEVSTGGISYIRTHYFYVACTGLTALGLCSAKHRFMFPLGALGFLLIYMIEAAKIALLVPIAMTALYFVVRQTRSSVSLYTGGMMVLTAICSLLTSQSSFVRFLADLLLVRSISIPGQTFYQYHDLFAQRGYTFWSNVSGIRWVVSPPAGFAMDQQWPVLGMIIGREYYGSLLLNANANLFAGEGVAAAGPIGVLVIGAFFCAWLRAFDLAAREWNGFFALLIAAPLGLCLTNAHLSTLMLSFGGAFWLLVLTFCKPGKASQGVHRKTGGKRASAI